jgi:isopentenyl-diphosphate delta-isomerase type 1
MEEYIDVVDDKGNPTGERKLKSLAHKNGDRHKTVHIWIMNTSGDLLIQRRSPTKENHPNLWDISCAGHISTGEISLQAAIREAKEELDITVKEQDLKYLFTIDSPRVVLNNGTYIDHEFQDVYLLQLDENISNFKLQTEEVAETKWVQWRELQNMIQAGDSDFVPHMEEYKKLFIKLAVNNFS